MGVKWLQRFLQTQGPESAPARRSTMNPRVCPGLLAQAHTHDRSVPFISVRLLDPLMDRPVRRFELLGQLVGAPAGSCQLNNLLPVLRRIRSRSCHGGHPPPQALDRPRNRGNSRIYIDLPDWNREDWAYVDVRTRASGGVARQAPGRAPLSTPVGHRERRWLRTPHGPCAPCRRAL